jgi:hypothetical protein
MFHQKTLSTYWINLIVILHLNIQHSEIGQKDLVRKDNQLNQFCMTMLQFMGSTLTKVASLNIIFNIYFEIIFGSTWMSI